MNAGELITTGRVRYKARCRPGVPSLWAVALAAAAGALGPVGCGTPFRSTDTLTITVPGAATKIVLDNPVGEVRLRSDSSATGVRADVIRIGKGATIADAEAALAAIELSFAAKEDEPSVVVGHARFPQSNSIRQYEVEWSITAPPSTSIEAVVGVGGVRVSGFHGNIHIKSEVGDIEVACEEGRTDGTGAVRLTSGVGDIRAMDAVGGLSAQVGVGHIRATAGGKIHLQSEVGEIQLRVLPSNPDAVLVRSAVGNVAVRVPSNRVGRLVADTDVGGMSVSLDGLTISEVRHRQHHFDAKLGAATPAPAPDLTPEPGRPAETSGPPAIDITAQIGNVTLSGYRVN